jgi:hypothetical protein
MLGRTQHMAESNCRSQKFWINDWQIQTICAMKKNKHQTICVLKKNMCILIKRIQELASTLSKIRSDVFLRKVAANDPKLQKYHQNQWTTRSTGIIYVKSFTTLFILVLLTIWVTDTMYYMYIPKNMEQVKNLPLSLI